MPDLTSDSQTRAPKLLTVVVTCFNEGQSIETTLREWDGALRNEVEDYELLVINDGSNDGTGRILDRLRNEMPSLRVFHQLNAGREAALRRGIELARGRYVLQVGGNGRYEPADFSRMWCVRGQYHLVLGTRDLAFGDFWEQTLTPTLLKVAGLFFGVPPRDPATPFRLFRRDVVRPYLTRLPADLQWVGLALALQLKRDYPEGVGEHPIQLRRRAPSLRPVRAFAKAREIWGMMKETFWLGVAGERPGVRQLAPSAA